MPTVWTWTNPLGGNLNNPLNWIDDLLNLTPPASSANSSLIFGGTITSYGVTNDIANFALSNFTFNQSAGTITLTGSAFEMRNVLGNALPAINVNDAGNVLISAGIHNYANFTTATKQSILLNLNSTGSLTHAGVLGGNAVVGASMNGFIAGGAGTGTLNLTGSGNTAYLFLNNRNTLIDNGNYVFSSVGSDNASTANSSFVLGSVATGNTSTLSIGNASQIKAVSITFGQIAGSSANAAISGAGTVVDAGTTTAGLSTNMGVATVGLAGSGNLTVTSGAVLNSYYLNIAQMAGSTGNLVLSDPGSRIGVACSATLTNSGQVLLGLRSTGCLTVQNGANLTARVMTIGAGVGSDAGSGYLKIEGANSVVNLGGVFAQNSSGNLILANGSAFGVTTGRLEILNGGVLNVNVGAANTGNFTAAATSNSQANITVSGAGSRFTVGNQFALGGNSTSVTGGNVALDILAGGLVQTGNAVVFARNGGNTAVTIDGTGSTFHTTSTLQSMAGNASILVRNAGNLNVASAVGLAFAASGSGVLTVTGPGSRLNSGGQFQTGCGTASVTIASGGNIASGGTVFLNTAAAGIATVRVDGPGSYWSAPMGFQNYAGAANITIENGGCISAGASIMLTRLATANTNITVTGNGSSFLTTTAMIHELGNASIQVTNGGLVRANTSIVLGNTSGANNTTILVDGPGSTLTSPGPIFMRFGTIQVDVRNGGNFSTGSSLVLAANVTGSVNVTVADPNSIFRTSLGLLVAGASGITGSPACLTVSNGGTIAADNGLYLYAPGTVRVNAGGTLDVAGLADGNFTNSAGTIESQTGGLIRLAPSGTPVAFSGPITGGGAILKEGNGIQYLYGTNSYAGGTTINNGTLAVASGSALGSGPVIVQGAGTLAGNGSVAGNVNVLDGGTLTGGATACATLTLTGHTTIAGGNLAIGLFGGDPGQHDQISLGTTGILTLGNGTGDAQLITGIFYAPTELDSITIIQGTGSGPQIFGTFAGMPNGSQIFLGTYAETDTTFFGNIHYTENSVFIDSFSTTPAPEPGSIVLFGGFALGVCGWVRRKRGARKSPPAVTGGPSV